MPCLETPRFQMRSRVTVASQLSSRPLKSNRDQVFYQVDQVFDQELDQVCHQVFHQAFTKYLARTHLDPKDT